jgi:hypothetical protein
MSEMDQKTPKNLETNNGEALKEQNASDLSDETTEEESKQEEKTETSGASSGKSDDDDVPGNEEEFDFSALLPGSMEELLQLNILQFREWAYVYMGLIPHPRDKKIVKDIRQAKMAVDSASALFEISMPHLNEKLQREFKVIISDLKMNFIAKANQ